MRVLMTTDAVGGVWNYSLTLARSMAELGVSSALAVLGPGPDEAQSSEAAAIPGLELYGHPGKLEWTAGDPWPDVNAAGTWLIELARECRPDVVHLNGYSHAALDFRVPKIVAAHSCVCSWWRAVHGEPAPGEWDEYRRRVRAGLDGANLIVAPSRTMLHDLEREYAYLDCPRAVIENAAHPPENPLPENGGVGRIRFILAAGRLHDESKNLPLLQQIARHVPWPIFAAGEGPPCNGVHMTGRLAHRAVLDRMARAEIFCHPALYEPFGLAPLEAALSGCALALSDIPSLRELWADAALFFNPRDARSASEALNRMIADEPLRRRLADSAFARAARFTPRLQAENYLRAYRSVRTFSGRETATSVAWPT
jgi:glycosyltransferase involved in cell wall biosynthesis